MNWLQKEMSKCKACTKLGGVRVHICSSHRLKFCMLCEKPLRKPAYVEDGTAFCKEHKDWLPDGWFNPIIIGPLYKK